VGAEYSAAMDKRQMTVPAIGGRVQRLRMAEQYVASRGATRVWSEGEKELVSRWVRDGPTDSPPWEN